MSSHAKDEATSASIARGYLPLQHYSLIGNCRTAALVAADASIDWLCLPHFDSNPCLSRILSTERGGFLAITDPASGAPPVMLRQSYEDDTAILVTDVQLASGQIRLTDFMPPDDGNGHAPTCLIRRITALQGSPRFALQMKIAVDYGDETASFTLLPDGALADAGTSMVALAFVETPEAMRAEGTTLASTHALQAGQTVTVALGWGATADEARAAVPGDSEAALEVTRAFWQQWVNGITYQGVYRKQVVRSAIVLKLLTFAPKGSVIAAPTTSIPERIGGSRNWDYRYTWLRDGSFTVDALTALGKTEEAFAFVQWLEGRERHAEFELRTIYTIEGRRELPEFIAEALEGYRGSRPVRVGNAAAGQTQLDIYGEWLDCVAHTYAATTPLPPDWLRDLIIATVNHVSEHWREPDMGIWEIRSEPQQFVYSKVMCWVAVERGIALAERFGWQADLARWRAECDAIRASVLENGIDPATGAFKMSYETAAPDAANLMITLVGFLPPTDPRIIATTDAIMRELRDQRGFVYRYRHFDDGVGGEEGTFVMCSFWLVENLARQGRTTEAHALFADLIAHVSPTGLLSEMIDSSSGMLLGNFPQAFSHLGIIRAALALAQTS